MRIYVIGGCGAYPGDGQACSGYLVEKQGFTLLVDPGYGVATGLSAVVAAGGIDAVYVSHGHPDHYADLHPVLRARVLGIEQPRALPVYAPTGAVSSILTLDGLGELEGAYRLTEFQPGEKLEIGSFLSETRLLPHFVPNAGIRLTAGGNSTVYTGDSASAEELVELARDADLLIAEATFPETMPERLAAGLSTAAQAGETAAAAGVGRLLLTHLWPGTDPDHAKRAACRGFDGDVDVARPGLEISLT